MEIPAALDPVVDPIKALVTQVLDDDVPDLAAGLAYRFLFAVFPFAIFLAALAAFVASWVGIGDPTSQILGAVGDNLPPDVARQLAPQLETVLGQARPGLLSIGAVLALWAAMGGIGALMKAMNQAYDVSETRGFVRTTAIAFVLTVVGSVGILVAFVTVVGGSILTQQAVQAFGVNPGAWSVISLIRYPVMLGLVALAVAALFRFGPNVAVSFRWTFVGGLLFAIGWIVATALFGLYVANFGSYANTYGALGGVVVLMLWFYLTALLLLVAAEITSMLATHHEPAKVEARRAEVGAHDGPPATESTPPTPRATAPEPAPQAPTPVISPSRVAIAPVRQPAARASVSAQGPSGRASQVFAVAVLAAGVAVGAVAGLLANDRGTPAA